MKIDSCLILKNEEQNIEKLINQLLEFSNEIHLTDTGSTDNTVNIIKEIHIQMYFYIILNGVRILQRQEIIRYIVTNAKLIINFGVMEMMS